MLNRLNDWIRNSHYYSRLGHFHDGDDSDSLWHGLEYSEDHVISMGTGGVKRMRLLNASDDVLIHFKNKVVLDDASAVSWSDLETLNNDPKEQHDEVYPTT